MPEQYTDADVAEVRAELAEVRQGLIVRPGDQLVLTVRPETTALAVDELLSRLTVELPDVRFVVVAADGLAVVRGDPDGPA